MLTLNSPDAMRLPTMVVEGMRLIKRLTLVLKDGVVEHVFYPVFPPNRSAADVIAWLQENTAHAHGSGVLIYTTPDCPHCRAAKTLLKEKGVAYVEVDVDRDPEAAHVMVARSKGRRTVPQIFIGPTHIGGGNDLAALEAENAAGCTACRIEGMKQTARMATGAGGGEKAALIRF